jgi:hypothetical protein
LTYSRNTIFVKLRKRVVAWLTSSRASRLTWITEAGTVVEPGFPVLGRRPGPDEIDLLGSHHPDVELGLGGAHSDCSQLELQPDSIIFGPTIRWGWYVCAHLDPWPMTDEQIWATAAVFGAIAGALVAGLALHMAGRHRSDVAAASRETSPEDVVND